MEECSFWQSKTCPGGPALVSGQGTHIRNLRIGSQRPNRPRPTDCMRTSHSFDLEDRRSPTLPVTSIPTEVGHTARVNLNRVKTKGFFNLGQTSCQPRGRLASCFVARFTIICPSGFGHLKLVKSM
jgi:hypothetical protein